MAEPALGPVCSQGCPSFLAFRAGTNFLALTDWLLRHTAYHRQGLNCGSLAKKPGDNTCNCSPTHRCNSAACSAGSSMPRGSISFGQYTFWALANGAHRLRGKSPKRPPRRNSPRIDTGAPRTGYWLKLTAPCLPTALVSIQTNIYPNPKTNSGETELSTLNLAHSQPTSARHHRSEELTSRMLLRPVLTFSVVRAAAMGPSRRHLPQPLQAPTQPKDHPTTNSTESLGLVWASLEPRLEPKWLRHIC